MNRVATETQCAGASAVRPVRVLIQAPDPITFTGIASWLRGRPEFSVVQDGVKDGEVDVVIAAAETLSVEVTSALRRLKATLDAPVVLLVDQEAAGDAVLTAVECNVVALLPRERTSSEHLTAAVATAARGGGILPPAALGSLLSHLRRPKENSPVHSSGLTQREIDVLRLLADGLDTAETAGKVNFSERAVKKIIHDLSHRLELRNRTHAVAYALKHGAI
ncbi:response regulator transcription factor [Amycolatopsis jejuensis]|uniref:response regulator transcription factor n=1 Tax=Amycolatopsis jejuensis TaxID=330084 RepID=UPI0007C4835C|nr:response regulator transcription factor [Amycolatopsis jejuensis]